jgi:hypothetical protein
MVEVCYEYSLVAHWCTRISGMGTNDEKRRVDRW